jgi:hypothetical protein
VSRGNATAATHSVTSKTKTKSSNGSSPPLPAERVPPEDPQTHVPQSQAQTPTLGARRPGIGPGAPSLLAQVLRPGRPEPSAYGRTQHLPHLPTPSVVTCVDGNTG